MKYLYLLIVLSLVLSSSFFCLAQEGDMTDRERKALSQQSDSLFAVGVDLYNSKKFAEAIEVFSLSDKIDKAILDLTSNRRDYSAMWLASCYYNLGDTVTASFTYPNYYMLSPVDRLPQHSHKQPGTSTRFLEQTVWRLHQES
jgi:TolA-binding protein